MDELAHIRFEMHAGDDTGTYDKMVVYIAGTVAEMAEPDRVQQDVTRDINGRYLSGSGKPFHVAKMEDVMLTDNQARIARKKGLLLSRDLLV